MRGGADHSTMTFGFSMAHKERDTNVTPTSHGLAGAMLLTLLVLYGSGAQTPGVRWKSQLNVMRWLLNFGVLRMELASQHPSGA
jgi:hypothetical protein